jgi:hypothetical protein
MAIDAEALKRNTDILTVIGHYVPLKKNGTNYKGLCPFHGESTPSFVVTPSKGFAHCFGCGRNHDVISFIMEMLNMDFPAACAHLGANDNWEPSISVPKAPKIPDRITSKPPPDEPTPSMALHNLGEPVTVFPFKDLDGSLVCYETRYADATDKSRMWSWGYIPGRNPRWQCGFPNSPRSLYGLHRIGEKPDAPVLITEGPKKADAGHRLLGATYASISWSGGANSVLNHVWEIIAGKVVLLWPDADCQRCKSKSDADAYSCSVGDLIPYDSQPGQKAMFILAKKLLELGCTVKIINVSGKIDGWDIADAEVEGWTSSEVREWAKPRAVTYSLDPDVPEKMNGERHEINGQNFNGNGTLDKAQSSYLPVYEKSLPDSRKGKAGKLVHQRVTDIKMTPIHWLWKGRLAQGKISLLVGNPGLGKSQTCASITSIVTTGGLWPDAVPMNERTRCEKGSVIILSSEDDPADTVKPRLIAAGADTDRIELVTAIREDSQDETPIERSFSVSTDLAKLGALMDQMGDVRLLIIDPISAYMGTADSYKDSDVRGLLTPLQNMAHERNFAILLIAHLTKSTAGSALMRVQGSVGLVAMARAVWGINEDPEDPDRRLFVSMKTNLTKNTTGLAFTIQSVELSSEEGPIETSRVMWEDEAVTISAEEAMSTRNDTADEREEKKDAKSFLLSLLADGPVASNIVLREAKSFGYKEITIRRAKTLIGAATLKIGSNENAWKWHLKSWRPENAYANREN